VVFGKLVIEEEIVNVGDVVGIGTARFLEVVSSTSSSSSSCSSSSSRSSSSSSSGSSSSTLSSQKLLNFIIRCGPFTSVRNITTIT
jgi:hypothetical protein